MCIISYDALTKGTFIKVTEQLNGSHVMAYKNNIKNKSGQVNAMHIPVPTPQPLVPENILDWHDEPSLLEDIFVDITARRNQGGRSVGMKSLSFEDDFTNYVVETGDYIIAIVNNIDAIEQTLADPRFRGYVTPDWVVPFYKETYPAEEFRFIWAIFKDSNEVDCSPVVTRFTPSYEGNLFFPTVDSHGEPPIIGQRTRLTQKLIAGSQRIKAQNKPREVGKVYLRGEGEDPCYTSIGVNSSVGEYMTDKYYIKDLGELSMPKNNDIVFSISGVDTSKNYWDIEKSMFFPVTFKH